MSDRDEKRRGAMAGGAAGLALGTWVASVLLVLTSTSILLLLLAAPLLMAYLGSMLGERLRFFKQRHAAVLGLSVLVLIAGIFVPERAQAYRFQRIVDTVLPVYPGSELKEHLSNRISGRRMPGFVLVYGSEDTPEAILGYLRPEMVKMGWDELDPVNSNLGILHRFRRPGFMVHIATDYSVFEFTITCVAFNLYHRDVATKLEILALEALYPEG